MEEEEEERKKMNKIGALQVWFFWVFSTLLKVRGTFRVGLALEYQREVVCKLFELLCFVFLGVAPIP